MLNKPHQRIAGLYLVIASVWILTSDSLLYLLGIDENLVPGISILKGIGFVLVTSGILYLHVRSEFAVRLQFEAALRQQIDQVRHSQVALEQSERRFRTAVQEAPLPIMIFAEDGEVLTLNRAWSEITGYSPEQLATLDHWTELAYGTDNKPIKAHIDRLFDLTHRIDEGDFMIRCADGRQRRWEFSSTPLGRLPDNRRLVISMAKDVTERWQAEDAARRTRNVLQRIFDNSHFLIAYLDANFNFIQVNERYARADERTPGFFIGRNHFDLYPNAEIEAIFRQVVATGQPVTVYSKPFTYPSNPERGTSYWDWNLAPVYGADDKVESLVFTLIDVTARVHTEQKLVESERFVNSVLRAVPDFIFIYDVRARRPVFANAGVTSLLGLMPDELLAMGADAIPRLAHPDDIPAIQTTIQTLEQVPDNTGHRRFTCRLCNKDGTWRWVQIQAMIFKRTESGAIWQVIGSAVDITENKLAEQRLRIKDSAIASSITATALADLDGRLTYVNDAFLRLWKLTSEQQALGRSVLEFWAAPEAAQAVITHISQQDSYVGEMVARLSDGTLAEVELRASMVRDAKGNPICLMGSFNDVTRQKQAEAFALENERLKAMFQKEHERNTFVQRIVSALSHDLRTPLTVISLARETLSRYGHQLTPEQREERLVTIGRQVQFALEMLEDTVGMARGNLSETEYQPVLINLSALCQVSVEEVGAAIEARHRMRFVNLGGHETAVVDEVLVSRILLNLLSNAIKYSPSDRDVRLELDRHDDKIVLRVIDHGVGIDSEELPHIFTPFYRGKTVGKISGTGLGLTIVRDCVERHHGNIRVESIPGQGSVFTVELPLEEVDQAAPQG